MKILIDCHEPNINSKYLRDNGFETETLQLPISDYYFEEKGIAFERKEIGDYVSSTLNKHLEKQLQQMENNFKYSYLIIIGKLSDYLRFGQGHWSTEQHYGSLVSISARHPTIKVIQTDNNKQAMYVVSKAIEKIEDGKKLDIYDTELLKTQLKTEDKYLMWVASIEGIGIKKAQTILEKYSFWQLKEVTITQLKEIEGIGDKLANNIKKYIY